MFFIENLASEVTMLVLKRRNFTRDLMCKSLSIRIEKLIGRAHSELSPIKRARASAKNDLLEGNFPHR
jgi:hypothetical protein